MRPLPLATFAACLLAAPAMAGTYTESVRFIGSPSDGGTLSINAATFNTNLGTLTGVSLTATGSYTPDIFVGSQVPTASVLKAELITFDPSAFHEVTAGTDTLQQKGAYLVGSPERFNDTAVVTNANALKTIYTGAFPGQIEGLANVDVFSLAATQGAWGSLADDVSQFAGDLSITYTYAPIPEPASLALLVLGAATLTLRRRPHRP